MEYNVKIIKADGFLMVVSLRDVVLYFTFLNL